MKVKNNLLNYPNLKIMQDTDLFKFSLDSIILPNFITIKPTVKRILDIGCGNAPIPLILSTKTKAKILGIEIEKKSFNLAKENIKINNLDKQITIINDDIRTYYKNQESDQFDLIFCNPPFFKLNNETQINNNKIKATARHEITLSLEDIIIISKKLLKNNASLALIHRPERFIEIIELLKKHNLEPKKIRFFYSKKDKNADMLLIEATKNGKPGIQVLPPIICHLNNGKYTKEILKCFNLQK